MKKQELQELRNKSVVELENLLKESREELRKLRFNLMAGKLKNISDLRKTKKAVARILTLLHESNTQLYC